MCTTCMNGEYENPCFSKRCPNQHLDKEEKPRTISADGH